MKPWSYSSLTDFEGCAKRYYLVRVAKMAQSQETEATRWGTEVHEALEYRIRDGTPLPEPLAYLEPYAAKFDGKGAFTELELAVTKDLRATTWDAPDVWWRGVIDVGVCDGKRAVLGDWKGLPLDTELPTPNGFTTMRDVAVGDVLFSQSGDMCAVVGKSEVKHIRCYKIRFDDTSEVVCDEEHLWPLIDGRVVPVTELCASDRMAVAAPIKTPDVVLPVDPYVLGLWLADGKHTSGEVSKPDPFVWDEVVRRGYEVSHDYSEKANDGKCCVRTIRRLRTELRGAGLLRNKHIPAVYLRASYSQRLDLLRGLMDGDGNANPTRHQAIFTTTCKELSDAVMELLLSLGQRPLQSVVTANGFGKQVTAYPISFRPNGINPFLLPRKADRVLESWGPGYAAIRRVVSVEETVSVETQCIAVDSPDHTYLCTRRFLATHNTGKPKNNHDQLKLFAAAYMTLHPEVESCRTLYIWLAHNKTTRKDITRADVDGIWAEFRQRASRLENAFELDRWPAKPSGLCGWCPCEGLCTHWKPRRK